VIGPFEVGGGGCDAGALESDLKNEINAKFDSLRTQLNAD